MAIALEVHQSLRGITTRFHVQEDLTWRAALIAAYKSLGIDYNDQTPFALLVTDSYVEVSDPNAGCVLRSEKLDVAEFQSELALDAPRLTPQLSLATSPARVQKGPISAHGLEVEWD